MALIEYIGGIGAGIVCNANRGHIMYHIMIDLLKQNGITFSAYIFNQAEMFCYI